MAFRTKEDERNAEACVRVEDDHPRTGDRRAWKRYYRKIGCDTPNEVAYREGQFLAMAGPQNLPPRLRRNPYPPGRRHDEWERGYSTKGPSC